VSATSGADRASAKKHPRTRAARFIWRFYRLLSDPARFVMK